MLPATAWECLETEGESKTDEQKKVTNTGANGDNAKPGVAVACVDPSIPSFCASRYKNTARNSETIHSSVRIQ